MIVQINLKQVAKRRNGVTTTSYGISDGIRTVSELITDIVKREVSSFNERVADESKGRLKSYLTNDEIENLASSGKINSAINSEKTQDEEAAIANAIQCFEDGIYRIFVGDKELQSLDEEIILVENDELTIVHLTMLSGRMW